MTRTKEILRLTVNKIFLYKSAPYTIYRHQVDGDHINSIHDHDFVELVMISGGTGTQLIPHGEVRLQVGALFVLQPGVWHAYVDCDAMLVNVCAIDSHVFECELEWMRDNATLRHLLWETSITASHAPIHYLASQKMGWCKKAFYGLQALERTQTSQVRAQQIGQLTTFLADVADWVSMKTPVSAQERKLAGLPDVVEKTLMCFSENLAYNWSISELSARFGLSTPYYIRLFKATMGESPLSYLSELRARRAAQILMCTDNPIMEVGADVGWTEPGYFSRRFRQFFGISPRAYRQKYRDSGYRLF
jgi:AraC family transcriptional regulator, L-rhamnose operon transcriptional activator RhaR